jgi:hypothetical protein
VIALVCLAWLATGMRARAQVTDLPVKAAFVLNFLKFVKWPDPLPDTEPLTIAVIGDADFAAALTQAAAGQTVAGRPVGVRAIRTLREADPRLQLLFIGASERDRVATLLREVEGRPVLTVGDTAGYGSAGVVLNFYVSDRRVRFEANTTAAARARLQLSSHLLRIARIVG